MNVKSKNTQEVMKKEWLYAVGLELWKSLPN